jgi:glycosyltransferase involved in cell wall biosynthesis
MGKTSMTTDPENIVLKEDRMANEAGSSTPLVSICIPTYNRADMVGKAIASALGQTYSNIEVIVVDNASTDNTEAIVAAFSDNRLRYIRNSVNLGLFGNFNRCIEISGGKYIHILHSDDFIDPEFTRTCVRFLEEHPTIAMTFTSTRIFYKDVLQSKCVLFPTDMILKAPEGFRCILLRRPLVSCPSVMIRKTVYDEIGGFSLEFPYSADLYQWLKISLMFDIAYVRDAFLNYREGDHTESYKHLFENPSGYLDTIKIYIRMNDELGDRLPVFSSNLNTAIRRHMKDCLYAGITRSDTMQYFSPTIFLGFAVNAWALIRPTTPAEKIIKFIEFLGLIAVGCIMVLPGGTWCLGKLMRKNHSVY